MKLRRLPGPSVVLRAGNVALAVVFVDVGVLIGNRVNRRQGIAVKHDGRSAMAEGAKEIGKALVPDFIGDDDAADRDRRRGEATTLVTPGRSALPSGITAGRLMPRRIQLPSGVLLAEGQQTEHAHERVFGGLPDPPP